MSENKYYDIGVNLFSSQFHEPETVLEEAASEGIFCILTGSDIEEDRLVNEFIKTHDAYGTAGIHPHGADAANDNLMTEIENIIRNNNVLIYFWETLRRACSLICHRKRIAAESHAEDKQSHNDAIPTEGFETILRHIVEEELNGQNSNKEGDDITRQQERETITLQESIASSVFQEVVNFLTRCSKHGWDGKEERKLCCRRSRTP